MLLLTYSDPWIAQPWLSQALGIWHRSYNQTPAWWRTFPTVRQALTYSPTDSECLPHAFWVLRFPYSFYQWVGLSQKGLSGTGPSSPGLQRESLWLSKISCGCSLKTEIHCGSSGCFIGLGSTYCHEDSSGFPGHGLATLLSEKDSTPPMIRYGLLCIESSFSRQVSAISF